MVFSRAGPPKEREHARDLLPGTGPPQGPGFPGPLATGLLLRLLIAWAPFSYLASRGPIVDDAFYSFSVARNIAAGNGPTADGIHATSGSSLSTRS